MPAYAIDQIRRMKDQRNKEHISKMSNRLFAAFMTFKRSKRQKSQQGLSPFLGQAP
jgi:hypothetical protein